MKPTVKSFLALAGDKEVFCGKSNDVPECYTNEKVTEWTISDTDEIVLYVK